jgi:hypothetical protein
LKERLFLCAYRKTIPPSFYLSIFSQFSCHGPGSVRCLSIYIIAQRYSVCSIKFSTFFKWWDIVSLITKYIYDVNSFSFKNLTKKKEKSFRCRKAIYSYLSKYVFKPCIFHRQSFVLRTSMFWCAIKICYLQICLHLSQLTKVQFCECFHTCSFPSSRVPFPVVCVAEFPP